MGLNAVSPIPGGKRFVDVVPGGDLTVFVDRWRWIEKDMLPKWLAMNPEDRAAAVSNPIGTVKSNLLPRFVVPPMRRSDEDLILDALGGGSP